MPRLEKGHLTLKNGQLPQEEGKLGTKRVSKQDQAYNGGGIHMMSIEKTLVRPTRISGWPIFAGI